MSGEEQGEEYWVDASVWEGITLLKKRIADQTAEIKRLHAYNAALSVTSVGELFDIVADMADAIERQEFDRAAHLAAKWREQQ